MANKIFETIVLRLPDMAFSEKRQKKEGKEKEGLGILRVTREECRMISEEDWVVNISDYWNYRDRLLREGEKKELGSFHEEIDRLYNSMKRGRSEEALHKHLHPAKLKEILKKTKIKDRSQKPGSDGFSWLALAGLYVHYNINAPLKDKQEQVFRREISEAVWNTLQGDSGLAAAIVDKVGDSRSKCLLNRLIERECYEKEVCLSEPDAKFYFFNAGIYVDGEVHSLKWKIEDTWDKVEHVLGEEPKLVILHKQTRTLEAIYGCFNRVYMSKLGFQWDSESEVDRNRLEELYYSWRKIPASDKRKRDDEWSPYFIVKGEKYMPEKVREGIANEISKHVTAIHGGLEWIRKKYRDELADASAPEEVLPIEAELRYIRESYDNGNFYRCFAAECRMPKCKAPLNPGMFYKECPACGASI